MRETSPPFHGPLGGKKNPPFELPLGGKLENFPPIMGGKLGKFQELSFVWTVIFFRKSHFRKANEIRNSKIFACGAHFVR